MRMPAAPILLLCALAARGAVPLEGVTAPFRQVELSAPVSSFIVAVKAQEGDAVKAGQPLLELYARLEELEMKRAKAKLDRREYEAKGAKNLYDNKIIPEATSVASRADLELARLNYETATEQFRLRTLLAPIDGLVVDRYREVGEAVTPSQPVFRLLDLSKVFILCALKPEQLGQATPGRKLSVHLPQLGGEATFQGEVVYLSPRADGSGLFKLKVLVDNPDLRIKAGLRALVELPN